VHGFSLISVYSLRLRKQRKKARVEARGRVKNYCRSSSQVYKGPGEIHPKLRPNPSWISNLKAKRFFRSSNDSRTRNRYPASRLSRRINSLAGHTFPLAGGRVPFRLCHDGCLKKGAPHCFEISPFFLSSLFLSLHRDREKGTFRRSPLQRRKRAPSPPTDQGFEGCAPRGSAIALEHSGLEPFTDQGFEGWPLEGIRQPPQNMQSQG
jgi:hypothetical protein